MTILPAPAARGPAASTSQLSPSESHPLKEQRRRLLEVQNQITQIDRTKTQLQLLLPLKGEGNSRRLSSSSEASSWSIASTSSKGSVASEIKGRELLLPLSSVAFVAATISATYGAGDEEEESPSIFVRKNVSTTGGDSVEGLVLFDEARSGAVKEDYEELSVASAIARLEEQRQSLDTRLLKLKDEVVGAARATLIEHLGTEPRSTSEEAVVTPVNEQGQALNEEGLPFVDPIEPLTEGQDCSGVSALAPLVREAMTKEERIKWMESLFSTFEEEERSQERDSGDATTPVSSPSRQRPEAHRRLSSAERPAPPKSVLKQTGPLPLPIPKFGSSGFRRGFLNLNPSSPAAEHSSDPVEAIDFSQHEKGRHVRSSSSVDDSIVSAAVDSRSEDERMSRSMELPAKEGDQAKRKKKTVRILSPERNRGPAPKAPLIKSQKMKSVRDAEDDGQDEAASILELLGLDAIKDHPQAAGLYEALKDSERMEQLAQKADAARIAALKKEAGHVKKAAVSQTVRERPGSSVKAGRITSDFEGGFRNQSPKASASAIPTEPTISQGISALQRASQSDAGLEQERLDKGLKPAVPHARPSKAYAEKMEAKRKGEAVARKIEEEEIPAKMSKVRFGDLEAGEEEGEEEKDSVDSIGMHISEEELDEDTVEALGYFSDEDYDPDIGLSDEEIMQSRPQFNADGSEITNEELRKEYERIKATLGTSDHSNGGVAADTFDDDNDEDDFLEGTDLSLHDGEETATKVSRFKQDRARRALSGQSATSNELGTGLDKVQNLGPRMLIPSIANIRFPVPDHKAVEGQEVQLQGKGDEEDDDLEELMRQRLHQRNQATSNGSVKKPAEATMPPQVVSAKSQHPIAQQAATSAPAKKPSLFKTRMNQK